ncbi:hypothetical protein L6164_005401 [Bauhinia variegata]|uniref:Uncharacterized protein n=1 Tax=Bauhinia variegata TaxID=167791 RepID=A0ACB9PR20_BAUVA|nr:hypothetical protein L6164_005401 [Bauhinia variegata]
MGCVSSNLLHHEEEFAKLGSTALGHHIVSLTSTTYGLLTLEPPHSSANPSTLPSKFILDSVLPNPLPEPRPLRSDAEVINSWELMAGLDADSFRFAPLPPPKPLTINDSNPEKENFNPNRFSFPNGSRALKPVREETKKPGSIKPCLDLFERICPRMGKTEW